jgi:tRNA (guanine-N7-)-methyltransferase
LNDHNLEIEIGSGKGNFLITKALTNPNINYIGIEKDVTVTLKTLKKINELETKPNNLLFINDNARHINNWFSKQSIDTIYLNFSDP